jgi:hypothetical protein
MSLKGQLTAERLLLPDHLAKLICMQLDFAAFCRSVVLTQATS